MDLALNVFNSHLAVRGPTRMSDAVWTQTLFQCLGFANQLVADQCSREARERARLRKQKQKGKLSWSSSRGGDSGGGGGGVAAAAAAGSGGGATAKGEAQWNLAMKFLTDANTMAKAVDGVLEIDERADGARAGGPA
jgi:hypothetical protein